MEHVPPFSPALIRPMFRWYRGPATIADGDVVLNVRRGEWYDDEQVDRRTLLFAFANLREPTIPAFVAQHGLLFWAPGGEAIPTEWREPVRLWLNLAGYVRGILDLYLALGGDEEDPQDDATVSRTFDRLIESADFRAWFEKAERELAAPVEERGIMAAAATLARRLSWLLARL